MMISQQTKMVAMHMMMMMMYRICDMMISTIMMGGPITNTIDDVHDESQRATIIIIHSIPSGIGLWKHLEFTSHA